MPNEFLVQAINPLISAVSGLSGIAIGGWVAFHSQKRDRQHRFMLAQLEEFYGPMLALRTQILAKSETREKVSGAAGRAWPDVITKAEPYGVRAMEEIQEERFTDFERIIQYENRQLVEELMPCYRRMVDLFESKMHFAERSTREHFSALVQFVEIWSRWLDKSLPPEVLKILGHSEESLRPLYCDLATKFEMLQKALKE